MSGNPVAALGHGPPDDPPAGFLSQTGALPGAALLSARSSALGGPSRLLSGSLAGGARFSLISLKPALAGLLVAGLVTGVSLVPLLGSTASEDRGAYASAPLVLVIGWGFIAAGVVAWLRRPRNGVGPLMTAVGFAWFLSSLIGSDVALLHTISLFGGLLWSALLIHLVLAFPSGRLQTRDERAVVWAGYGVATVLQVPPLLFAESAGLTCRHCPRNLALLDPSPGLAGALFTLQLLCAIGVLATGFALLVRRWRETTAPQRRALAPVLWSGGATALVAVLSLAADLGGFVTVSAGIDWAYLALFASIPFAFLVGLLRSRLHRADAVSELVKRLGQAPRPGGLRNALADALDDPSLSIVYWLPERECYVDASAQPVELPCQGSGRAARAIEHDGRRVAAIVHDPSLCEEPQLVSEAGAAAALGLERERLATELRARVEELRASRARIVETADLERRRLERNLHDGAQQRLVSLLLGLKLGRRRAHGTRVSDRSTASDALLDEVERELPAALAELRALAGGILPPLLSDLGLAAAVEQVAARSPISVEVEEVLAQRLPERLELAAYFVISEALTNTAKHARASRARVRIAETDGRLLIEVSDDGVGGAHPAAGSGLEGLGDRVGALNGRLELDSPAGQGTTLRAEIPCAS
jgi:signal transduction histidine kinase